VKFELVDAEKANYPVAAMCHWLEVSRSGYYAWVDRKGTPSTRKQADEALLVEIRSVYREHKRRYGSPRVFRALRGKGRRVGRKRVERLMRQDGLRARRGRRFIVTTDSRGTTAPAPNRLKRDFRTRRPNRAWVGDVTYIPTLTGWLYLAVLIDLGSRRVVGWATSRNNDTDLALAALRRALAHRRVRRRMIHHTDRGSPYASLKYLSLLSAHGIVSSMSRKGDCWDNAVAESFFATLKAELVLDPFPNQQEAHRELAQYIDGYYNTERMHSALGYVSPVQHEAKLAA
jgi:putative transposase